MVAHIAGLLETRKIAHLKKALETILRYTAEKKIETVEEAKAAMKVIEVIAGATLAETTCRPTVVA